MGEAGNLDVVLTTFLHPPRGSYAANRMGLITRNPTEGYIILRQRQVNSHSILDWRYARWFRLSIDQKGAGITPSSFAWGKHPSLVWKFSKLQAEQLKSVLNGDALRHRKAVAIHDDGDLFSGNGIRYVFNGSVWASHITNAAIYAGGFKAIYTWLTNPRAVEVFCAEPTLLALPGFSATNVKGRQPLIPLTVFFSPI